MKIYSVILYTEEEKPGEEVYIYRRDLSGESGWAWQEGGLLCNWSHRLEGSIHCFNFVLITIIHHW